MVMMMMMTPGVIAPLPQGHEIVLVAILIIPIIVMRAAASTALDPICRVPSRGWILRAAIGVITTTRMILSALLPRLLALPPLHPRLLQ